MIHPVQKRHYITITVAKLQNDKLFIKKYVTVRAANDIKKARRWGRVWPERLGELIIMHLMRFPLSFLR